MADFGTMLVGVGSLALGALGVRYGYQIARFSEQADAIGSTTPMGEVEPAGWKVIVTQLGFGLLGALGILMVILAVWP
ncbi:hypothetical protein BG842_18590 [Haladaptatus sp. W1]|uniref:hypothetical protein n=1 Tax=Haladaptatus sp. W1 TaxID=1897478 RepID=UPI0008499805|nr:hypothetical protein [Haladaptatus sp. W1]ODR83424.1 hypothetical protein BG842_18590 [Haladaptatus sp. W1]